MLLWDVALGPDYELARASRRRLLRGWATSGTIAGAIFAPPCGGWMHTKVAAIADHIANALLMCCISLCHMLHTLGRPWVLLAPDRSKFWTEKVTGILLRRKFVHSSITSSCAWGAGWRLDWRLVSSRLTFDFDCFLCKSWHGKCSFSSSRHDQFSSGVKSLPRAM